MERKITSLLISGFRPFSSISGNGNKVLLSTFCFLLFSFYAFSQVAGDYRSVSTGTWSTVARWEKYDGAAWNAATDYPGQNPGAGTVTIQNTHVIDLNVSPANPIGALQMNGSSRLRGAGAFTLNVTGDVQMDGTSRIYNNGGTSTLNAATLTVLATSTAAKIGVFNINISGATTVDGYLEFNGASTKNFAGVTINGTGEVRFTVVDNMNISNDLNVYGKINNVGVIGTINVTQNLHTYSGCQIGPTATTTTTGNLNVTGTYTVEAGGTSIIDRINLTLSSTTTVDGTLQFASPGTSGFGTKSFRAVTVSGTGTWDNSIGENISMNGNIVNNGTWTGAAAGSACIYDFGITTAGPFSISGNPVTMSHIRLNNGRTLTNLGTLIIDGDNSRNAITRASGNVTFNNGDGAATAILYLQDNNTTPVTPAASLVFNTSFANNTVYYSRSGNQTVPVPSDGSYYNLNISGSGTKTDAKGLTIGNNLSISGGTYLLSGNKTSNITGSIVMTGGTLSGDNNNGVFNAAALDITDGSTINGTSTFSVNVGTLTCHQDVGASSAIKSSIDRCNLTMTGATTIDGDFTFSSSASGTKKFRDITISATGTWDNTVGEDPRIDGNIVNNGSWLGPTGGTADYSFGRYFPASYTISGNPVVFSRLSIYNGTTITNLGTVIIDGNVDPGIRNQNGGTSTFTNGNGGILYIQTTGGADGIDAPGNNLDFNASTVNNTVNYSRSGSQNVRTPTDGSYYNLILSNSGTKSFQTGGGTITTDNLLTIQDAVVLVVGATETLNGAGGLTMTGTADLQIAKCDPTNVPELTGTYSLTGGTITLNGACNQTWNSAPTGANTCYNLVLSGSGTKCIAGLTTISGDITISGSASMGCNSGLSMDCSKTFTYSSTGTSTLAADLSVGSFSQTAGTLDDGGFNITVCGSSWDRSAGTFTASGRVTFNGSTTVSGAATTTFNNVTINPSKTLIGHATNMIIKGADFTNNGTFTHNSGTVTTGSTTASTVTLQDAWATSTTANPANFAVTGSQGSRLLVVVTGMENTGGNSTVTGVTYGGLPMTQAPGAAITVTDGVPRYVGTDIWYLNDDLVTGIPAAASTAIVVSWSAAPTNYLYGVSSYTNVDQSTPIGNTGTGSRTSAGALPISAPLTVSVGDYVVFVSADGRTTTFNNPAPYTEDADFSASSSQEEIGHRAIVTAGSETPTATAVAVNAQTISAAVLRGAPIAGAGTTTIQGSSVTTFSNLTISGGTLVGHATEMIVQGNFTNNSVFTHNNGKVTFTGGNAQSLAGTTAPTTFYDLEINKTAGTTLTQTITTATVSHLLTITEGIFDINTNTLNGAGALTMTGGDFQIAKTPGTVPELTGTYTITGGTVTLDGAGIQTLNTAPVGADTYYNLLFGNSGAKTITGLLTINGDVTVSGTATLTGFSAFTQASAKTFNYSSTGTTTVTAGVAIIVGSYNQTSSAGGITLPANAGNTMTVKGATWVKSGAGTFTNTSPSRVIFNRASGQTFTDNGTVFSNVTINSSSGVTLNNNMSITTDLTFTAGNIVTGTNNVILTATTTTVTRTSGFVEGNLRKAIAAGASVVTYEVGTGSDYTPVVFSFNASTTAGNLTCASTAGDHPDIFASTINPSKTVNRYWTITNNTIGTIFYDVVFNFVAGDIDAGANVNNVNIENYNTTAWNTNTTGIRTATSTQITGLSTPGSGSSEYFQIGESYNAALLWNAVTGGGNLWSDKTIWIQERTQVITTSTASATVTGTGTLFTTELVVGDVIMSQISPGTVIGTVASITDDVTLTLTANAATNNTNEPYGRQKVPDINDKVNIGNPNAAGADVTILVDISANANRITFTSMARSNTLQHNASMGMTVASNATIGQPSNANTNTWSIGGATVTVGGNLIIGSDDATAGRIANVTMTTGTLNINTNLLYSTATAANAVLDLTGGAGRVNLSGALILNSAGTLSTAGTENIFNYNRTAGTQTVTVGSSIAYRNLYLNNTSAAGATIAADITAANVTGDFRLQTGLFTYGGALSITGNAGRTFQVASGATFEMTGTSTFPTGFGTFTFGSTSRTKYLQTTSPLTITAVASPGYGHLHCQSAGTATQRFPAGTIFVQSSLLIGDATNSCTVDVSTNNPTVNVGGYVFLYANSTLSASASATFNAGGWTNNGGTFTTNNGTITFNSNGASLINGTAASQTFYNIVVSKTAGTTLSCGGSTTSLTTNNITLNTGNFTAPATLNMTAIAGGGNLTLNGGTFTAGANIGIRGNWTNNGGTFDPNGGLVTFNNGSAQNINGTAASQTFYNVEINKSAGSVTVGGSTTTLTVNNFTQTAFGLNVSAATTAFNANGNFTITSGTFTPCNNINIGGNIAYNGGTLTWGTGVTLNGSTAQAISGSSTIPTFTNLTINNTYPASAITLSKPITVNGVFTLTDGHLITDATNIITLNDPATVSGGNDSSFVKGPMAYIELTNGTPATKVFPVGKENLMHKIELNITHSSAGTNTYTAEYYLAADARFTATSGWTLPADVERVSAVGHWDLSKSGSASISNGSVKLYYITSDEAPDNTNLCVVKGNPSAWINIGGTGTAPSIGSITSTVNFTTFSHFGLGNLTGGSNPLPVELISFDATLNKDVVDLSWSTASEINNDYFTIERTTDGVNFEMIATVNGAGNSTEILNYKTIDDSPVVGISYYRLKQTDFDGKYKYSRLVVINVTKNTELDFNVFPNPSSGENTQISVSNGSEGKKVLLVVYGVDGKEEFSKVIVLSGEGQHVVAIDPSKKLAPGVYFIIASSDQGLYRKKLIVE